MNIEQVKRDMDAGVMVSRGTVVKLVEAALMMQQELRKVDKFEYYCDGEMAMGVAAALAKVEAL